MGWLFRDDSRRRRQLQRYLLVFFISSDQILVQFLVYSNSTDTLTAVVEEDNISLLLILSENLLRDVVFE